MITRDQLIEIGHFNKAHGVNGEVNASLQIEVEHLPSLSCLVCDMDGIYVPIFVEAMRPKGATTVLLTIDGFTSEQEVATLVGKDIFALKSDYDKLANQVDEDDDELPLDYFIGFRLTDNDTPVGEIVDVDESTENALFIVRRDEETLVAIPAVDDLIISMDMTARVIDMDLPEGLLSIN